MGLDNPIHILLLLLLLLLVVLLVFGAKRLPEIGRSLGDGMRRFKESIQGDARHSHMLERQGPPAPPMVPATHAAPAPTSYTPPVAPVAADR